MKKQKRWILKLIVLLTITQLLQCPAVKYNNPTDGANGLLMQLLDTIMATLAGVNTGSELRVVLIGNPSAITEGQSATVQMKLSKAITADLVITLSMDNPIMKIDGADKKEFAFTPDNATVEQSFTLAALADGNSISETVNLKITGVGLTEQSFSISTIDNTSEIVQTVIFTGLPATITEGQTSIVQVKLAKEITSALTVVLILDNSAITVDGSSFKIMNFPAETGTVDQTILLTAVSDTNSISETVNMKVSATGVTDKTFSISTIDNTVEVAQALVFTGLPTTMTEGQSATVQVKLAKEITSTVTVTVSIDNPAIQVNGGSANILTFTSGSGTVNQPITLSAVSDTNSISETVNMKVTATGLTEQNYSISTIDKTVEVVQAVVFTGLPATMTEGQTAIVQVKLAKEVTSTVTVNLTMDNSAITIDGISSKTLTFVAGNGTSNQSFTLAAVKDSNQISETVIMSVVATGMTNQTFTISTIDNTAPPPVITVSNIPASIPEGQTGTVGIKLSGAVTETFILTVNSGNASAITVSPSILTFTPANFSVDQTVTLTAVQDANAVSDSVAFDITASGLNKVNFTVATVDDDVMSISIAKIFRVLNGGIGSISIGISNQPISDYVVTLTSSNPSALSISSTSLTFTPSNYNQSQVVTVNCTTPTAMQYELTASANGASPQVSKIFCVPSLVSSLLGVLRTGQLISYLLGDDGTHQKTISHSYVDNGDGTVTDNVTGLIWQKCSSDSSCSGTASTTTNWTTADTYCSGLNLASKTWRLPTIQELSSLQDLSKVSLSIDSEVFPSTVSHYYWSSTLHTANATDAWYVTFNANHVSYSAKTISTMYVRCVSGPTSMISTFTDNSDGTVTDNSTKLVWQKCIKGRDPTTCSGSATTSNWSDAISYCNSLSLASKIWRLPNRNELQSIVDYTKSIPAIDSNAFPSTQSSNFWSSTTYAGNSANAWTIIFIYGVVSSNAIMDSKTNPLYVRCVSGP